MAVHLCVCWVQVHVEVGRECLILGVGGEARQIVPLVLDLVPRVLLVVEVTESVVHILNALYVNLLVKLDLFECLLIELGQFGLPIDDGLKFFLNRFLSTFLGGQFSIFADTSSLIGSHAAKRDFKNLSTGHLVVVSRPLCLNDVFVASKGIAVVHVAQFLNQLVHFGVIEDFLIVNLLCLGLDNVVVLCAHGQVHLVVHFVQLQELLILLLFEALRGQFCISHLSTHLLYTLFDLIELIVRVEAALGVTMLILSLCNERGAMTLQIELAVSVVHSVLVQGLFDVGGCRSQLTHLVWLEFVGEHVVFHILRRQLSLVVVAGEAEGLLCLHHHHRLRGPPYDRRSLI